MYDGAIAEQLLKIIRKLMPFFGQQRSEHAIRQALSAKLNFPSAE
jgi:hypothetical protein